MSVTEPAVDRLRFAPLSRGEHRGLLHGWLRADHVRPWWGVEGGFGATDAYIDEVDAMTHQRGWIVRDDDGPFGYVESYVVSGDPLAGCYDVRPGDRGFHLLVGPPERLGTSSTRALAVAVLTGLLAEPAADRALCEPNVRNARMRGFCAALGAEQLAELPFGGKTAALLAWDAADVARRFPAATGAAKHLGRRWDAMAGRDLGTEPRR